MMLIGRKAKAASGASAARRAPFWHRMRRRKMSSERESTPASGRASVPGTLSSASDQAGRAVEMPPRAALDPVSLAVLVISNVAPATMRACVSGLPVEVKAPDEATATVIRAALAETSRRRTTDRLIRVVVVDR